MTRYAAMADELQKIALNPAVAGGLLGAGTGAAYGALKAPKGKRGLGAVAGGLAGGAGGAGLGHGFSKLSPNAQQGISTVMSYLP